MESMRIEEYLWKPEVLDLLKMDVNLFTCETPIGTIYDEFCQKWWEKNEKHVKQESCGNAWKSCLSNDETNGDSNATQANQERFKGKDVNDGLGN
ncbi:hypothetical protein Tco_1511533, partial [Tanacetum coccineum]